MSFDVIIRERGMRVSCLAGVAVVIVVGVGSAIAADMPVKAPISRPPPAVYGWTGFYLGANVGLSVARDPTGYPAFSGLDDEQFKLSPIGVIGGGQLGYNWQVAPNWVLGVEADFQGSGQRDSSTCVTECLTDGTFQTRFAQRLAWFGTARARVGWTNGPVLLYGTGGWAYGRVGTDFDFVAIGAASALSVRSSQDKSGWAAGAGIEAQLVGNWTGKIEYLYVDLGSVGAGGVVPSGGDAGFTFAFSSAVHDHIVRAGVNYKF